MLRAAAMLAHGLYDRRRSVAPDDIGDEAAVDLDLVERKTRR